ncbi:MAG: UvrD-helicase domain-containing protein [Burkholderiales bacterium]|jgi:ATP-dependent DNA helicase Rep
MDTLNPAQREAVKYLDGPCLVIAGAGSGKTRVITKKIVHLIDGGVSPRAIAAITFTNKAAKEMADRLGQMVRLKGANKPLVSTFHSLGVQMLREDGTSIGLKKAFSILDSDDAASIVAQLLSTTDRKLIRAVQSRISLWKNAGLGPDEAAAAARDTDAHTAARLYRDYAATLAGYQAVDFDDLIGLPLKMLAEVPEVAERWQNRLRYLLVDEYQDTNVTQYELLKRIVGPRGAFTAVGDDDQSIYGWRGATLENLRRLSTDFPKLRVIKLEQNYRSSRTILAAANRLIANNPKLHEKTLWSELGVGDPIRVIAMDDDEVEAESIAMRLQAHKFERRGAFSDYAVLYRGNHQARAIELALRKEKIPYVLSGGQSWFERAEIRDLIAWLRLLANDDDDPAFIRAITTPKRGVGPQTLQALGTYAGERHVSMFAAVFEHGIEERLAPRMLEPLRTFGNYVNRVGHRAKREPAGALLEEIVKAIGYHEHLLQTFDERQASTRWQNVTDFIGWIAKRGEEDGKTLIDLAQTIALLSRLDGSDADSDAVRLTTVHASKGLEWPHVFIAGCEEGLMPHTGDAEDEDDDGPQRVEEERRLMYVAVTRAQRTLTITWCRQRRRAKAMAPKLPSRFIAEMGLDAEGGASAVVEAGVAKQKLASLRDLLKPKTPPAAG